MSYYQYHVFFCTNQREDGSQCCGQYAAQEMRDYAKKRCKKEGLVRSGKVRINTAGCLNRCASGPVVVIYPEETWYTWVDKEDIDEIIEEHLVNDRPVKRLMIDPVQ
jgi:(2Fe-2S) ferredoxin